MPAERIADLLGQLESMESARYNWDWQFQDLADFLNPRVSDFTTRRARGERRRRNLYDETAEEALDKFASGMHNAMTPEGQEWFFLRAIDDRLNRDRDARLWLEDTTRRMHMLFNSPASRFHPNAHQLYLDQGAFGTSVMFIGERIGIGPFFQGVFLGQAYIDEDETGAVDTLFRQWRWTPKQIIQAFGREAAGERVRRAFDAGRREELTVVHAVKPRSERLQGRADRANKPWSSTYILKEHRQRLSDSGFDEFPYVVPRWTVNSAEIYGRGPGHRALATAKMLNEMEKTQLKGLQKLVDPPLQVPDDGFLSRLNLNPGALNYVRRGLGQNERIEPITTNGRPDLGEAKENQKREAIRRAFYNDLFEIPGPVTREGSVTHMSATEAAIHQRDRLARLGPIFSRQKVEYLAPMIFRTLMIMVRAGMTAPPPRALAGARLDVEYVSQLAIAQGAGEVGNIAQTFGELARWAEIDPSIFDGFDVDAIRRIVAERLRYPTRALRSPEQIRKIRQTRAEAAQAQREAETGEQEAQAVKNVAQAEKAISGAAAGGR